MLIKKDVYNEIIEIIGASPIESGGIIGIKNGVICSFYFDGYGSRSEYVPKVDILNSVIELWAKDGIEFAGIVHSHPNGLAEVSDGDKRYAQEILKSSPWLKKIYFPILVIKSGNSALYSFEYDGEWKRDKISLV